MEREKRWTDGRIDREGARGRTRAKAVDEVKQNPQKITLIFADATWK